MLTKMHQRTALVAPHQAGVADNVRGGIAASLRCSRTTETSLWECLDHIVTLGEDHLRRVLVAYAAHYNDVRPHFALVKDVPLSRPVQRFGEVMARSILGGLHHGYCRTWCSMSRPVPYG